MSGQPSIAVLAIGRSAIRRRILALLLADPNARLHLREIQRRAGTTPGTASRELAALVSAGLIERRPEGQQVFFRASDTPFAVMLRSMLAAEALSDGLAPGDERRVVRGVDPPARARSRSAPQPPSPAADTTIDQSGAAPADTSEVDAARRFAAAMRDEFGQALVAVWLHGARLRREVPPTAPLEFVVVMRDVASYGDALERSSRQTAGLSVETGRTVSRIFVTEDGWRDRQDAFFVRARAEAVAVG